MAVTAFEKPNVLETGEITIGQLLLKIKAWLKFLFSKWLILLFFVLLGCGGGVLYFILTKPLYKAELTFVVGESGSTQMAGLSSIASQFGLPGLSGNTGIFDGQNLIEFMQSRKLIEKVLLSKLTYKDKETTIADLYLDTYGYRDKWKKQHSKFADIIFNGVSDTASHTLDQNIVLGTLYSRIRQKNLIVGKKDKESNIMAISFISENEILSERFANQLANDVSTYYIVTKTKKYAQNVAILQHQTDSVRRMLSNAIKGVAAFTENNPNPNSDRKSLLVPSQNRQVDVQANQAILTQLVQNLEIAKIALRNETPLIQIIDAPVFPLDVIKLPIITVIIIGAFIALFIGIGCLTAGRLYKKFQET